MKIPPWVLWGLVILIGWKMFGDKLFMRAAEASGAPESNPQASTPPSGTPAPSLFDQLLGTAKDISDSFTKLFAQTSVKTS